MLKRSLEPGNSQQVRPTVGSGSPRPVTRRRLLGLGATLTLLGLAGCQEQPVAAPPPLEADEVSVNRAVATAQRLRADALAAARSQPSLARLLHRVAAVHEQHLQALGAPVAPSGGSVAPSGGSVAPSGSSVAPSGGSAGTSPATAPPTSPTSTGKPTSPGNPTSPGKPTSAGSPSPTGEPTSSRNATSARLAKAEAAAARAALRDGLSAAAPFAVLLCRIAAARVVNADLVSAAIGQEPSGRLRPAAVPTSPPSPSASGVATSRAEPPARDPGSAGSNPAASRTAPTSPGDRSALDLLFDTADPLVRTPDPIPTSALDQTPSPGTTVPPSRPAPTATGSKGPADLRTPTTPALVALDRLLAGEHAAVFVYPLIVARTRAGLRNLATVLWQTHRNERDQLSVRLLAAGIRPAVAEPAYDVGALPTTGAKAAMLAARVEVGLAALATDLLAAGQAGDADRSMGADHLVLAARRTARWTGTPTAFPGRSGKESSDTEVR